MIQAEATYKSGRHDERNNVFVTLAIDASQREQLKQCHDMMMHQVSILAEWEDEPEQAMGVYLLKEMKMGDSYLITLRSDLHSAEEKKWIDLRAACNSDKEDERMTFQLTILTVDEAVAYYKNMQQGETGANDDDESDEPEE